MPKPMTKFKPYTKEVELHSFIDARKGKTYAFKGNVKTYSNKTQAEKASAKLSEIGISVFVSFEWTFTLHPLNQ